MPLQLNDELRTGYRGSIHGLNDVLKALAEPHDPSGNGVLVQNLDQAGAHYTEMSRRLEDVLFEFTSGENLSHDDRLAAEGALANAAFVDGLLGLRALLLVSDSERPDAPFNGLDLDGLGERLGEFGWAPLADAAAWVSGNGVSDQLIDAALSGEARNVPEDRLLDVGPGHEVEDGVGPAETIKGAFGLVLDPAAQTLVEATKDAAMDFAAGFLVKAAPVLAGQLGPLIETLQEVDLHYVRVPCRRLACNCLRRLLAKMRADALGRLQGIANAFAGINEWLDDTVAAGFCTVLAHRLTQARQTQLMFGRAGIPEPGRLSMTYVAREGDARSWAITRGLAKHAIPIAAASAPLFGVGGVPVTAVLLLASIFHEAGFRRRQGLPAA